MSVYNGEKYLKEAIDSILRQTYRDFEFLIINDASRDSSRDIILGYDDPRIKLVDNKVNLGLTASLNKGLQLAKGKYIARMDADDISLQERFSNQIKYMDENSETGLCGTWFITFGLKNMMVKTISDPDLLASTLLIKNQVGHPTAMIRKSVLEKYNLSYDESLQTSQDYNLWLKISRVSRVTNLAKPLLMYRVHPRQIINVCKESSKPYTHAARTNYLRSLGLDVNTELDEILYKSYFNIELSINEIKILKGFFEEIILFNKQVKIYKHSTLKGVLNKKIKDTIRYNRSSDSDPLVAQIFFVLKNDLKGIVRRSILPLKPQARTS